ncbi:glycoside hydrolase family 26 protein [Sediminitomix flava]|uniref:Mannan endo-1,4-beta-mannosidase n=1 Tax=Sediminitomix flava TaxID=379075 RepID=A0A315ZG76_SEDFL|nr:glycosyl hydrolase [Sediminitomix flava]PWJ44595.1 mannan endo-1,4-beta-mannosidase [Sediminitomix flava]
MKKINKYLGFLTIIIGLGLSSCQESEAPKIQDLPADNSAEQSTINLYHKLKRLAPNYTLFGHQDNLAYGIGWAYEEGKSDVKEVVGDYPALYGWDAGGIGGEKNLDGVPFKEMQRWMKEVHQRGGVNTLSWHVYSPVDSLSSWETDKMVVSHILPGGKNHEGYLTRLDDLASFFKGLKLENGEHVPVIFRPFHENNGNWFWWGEKHCSTEGYKMIFRFTVDYFRSKGVHNLLYAYSPDRIFETKDKYLERYPGDDYVDILGLDDYWDFKEQGGGINEVIKKLEIISVIAQEKGKLCAFTETGLELVSDNKWFTEKLYKIINTNNLTKNIAYVMVWRNGRPDHYYVPYKGHEAEADFKAFYDKGDILFETDLKTISENGIVLKALQTASVTKN